MKTGNESASHYFIPRTKIIDRYVDWQRERKRKRERHRGRETEREKKHLKEEYENICAISNQVTHSFKKKFFMPSANGNQDLNPFPKLLLKDE